MKVEIKKNRYGINAGCLICNGSIVWGKFIDLDGNERKRMLTLPEVAELMRSMDGKNHKVFWEEPEGEE